MIFNFPFRRLICLVAAGVFSTLTFAARGGEANGDFQQQVFASPEDAVKALRAAVESNDKAALNQMFGPDLKKLRTGDAVQDTNNFKSFAKAVKEKCEPVSQGDNEVVLNVGADAWAFPIPLMKQDGQWYFDTAAGREEIINRHVGHDELNAIGLCQAYVTAQHKYFDQNPDGSGTKHYAQKFKSTSGQKDGLYWKSTEANDASPLNEVVTEARAEGYHHHNNMEGSGPSPYHGYLFKILTRQGHAAAGGKMNYLVNGQLAGGFALVAYPAQWGQSGVMTFIVNQDGQVYECNLGHRTAAIAASMTEYNPTSKWSMVHDQGITENDQADSTAK